MKSFYAFILFAFIITSCKSDKSDVVTTTPKKELTTAKKIANAHGFENWKNITEVKFTFKVDRDSIKGNGRSWTWLPQKDSVYMNAGERTIKYSRGDIDSTSLNADRAFINDKYWAFVPFQLVWDESATISKPVKAEAPISKTELNKITILYPDEGGYTPGDAYDIYYGDNYMIKEWSFRQGNDEKIGISTTFENYVDYNGIKIATDHKQDGGKWNLNFANISTKTSK